MKMPYPLLRLVDAPALDALVRLDLNQPDPAAPGLGSRHPLLDGWDFGTPELDGDVDALDPLYGAREIKVRLRVVDNKARALALMSQLARELLRADGWLMFQLAEGTAPIWWRLYRPLPDALEMTHVDADEAGYGDKVRDVWTISVRLPAEAFAYGEEVTLAANVLVPNDPTVAGGCHIVVDDPPGDAPTALTITAAYQGAEASKGNGWLFVTHAAATPRPPVVLDLGTNDGITALTDCSAPVVDATSVGGSHRVVDFATAQATDRVEFALPAGVAAAPGGWKVLLRLGRRVGTTLQARFTVPGGKLTGDIVAIPDHTTSGPTMAAWLDLGDFELPPHAPPRGVDGVAYAPLNKGRIYLARTAGVDPVTLDAIMFVPIGDEQTVGACVLASRFTGVGIPSSGVWEGRRELFWSYSGDKWYPNPPELIGAFPKVVPGQVNTITLLREVDPPQASGDTISVGTLVTITAHPRHLYLGGQ